MTIDIHQLVQTNNDSSNVVQLLTNAMSKFDARSLMINYKLNNKLTKNKSVLVDQVLTSIERLITI